ncbi:hypothetical protein HR060_17400 [Catenovulum sp. SM1970]|nr:hypothetical protein [Marinifaba aquimaris]
MLQALSNIEGEVGKLNQHKLIKAYNSLPKLIVFQLLKGMAFGLGSVIGATAVLSVVVFLLSQIEFVPIIGEWVKELLQEIRPQSEG